MRTRLFSRFFLGCAVFTAFFIGAAHATPEPPASADDFVDRIGFATHWGYPDTPYGYAYDAVSKLLADMRVRHVRDGWHPRERDLWEKYGIKTTMIVGPQQPLDQTLKILRDNRDLISMVEGPNEVDIFPTSANYKGQGFPEGPKNFQNDFYNALKADPLLKDLGVIAPSTARSDANLKLAPLRSFDYLVMHSYAGGQLPSSSLGGEVVNNTLNATRILGSGAVLKPIIVTESGYHTALGANQVIAGVQPGVSEAVQAKYLPRHFAEYFNAGIRRTITYEFINEFKDEATNAEASFGIVRRDLTPKPAYNALKNLISLLSEAKWDATKKVWEAPPVHLRALDFDLEAPPSVHYTLLQKSDGTFYLLLWNEVSSFDTEAKKDIAAAPVRASLKFATAFQAAHLSSLTSGEVRHWNTDSQVQLDVPDEIVVLQITPRKRTKFFWPPGPPQNLKSETTRNSATLNWQPVRGAWGYFVWRLGRYLGFTEKPNFHDANVQPNTGYPYEVRAVGVVGNMSAPVSIVAMTKNEFPDLQVTKVSWTPAQPKVGEEITFSATIKNSGTAASPAGITHGVAFFVDDQFVSWADTFNKSLAPGQSITLASNNGPKGKKSFSATPGAHTVRAVVDDVNRINESDENNNTKQITLTPAP